MRYVLTLLLALMATASLTPAVTGKPLGKILRQSGLSPEDFELLGAAEMSLLKNGMPRAGSKTSWSNPETKSHGIVRVAAIRENCVYFQHFFHPKGDAKQVELRDAMCRTAEGKWLLSL